MVALLQRGIGKQSNAGGGVSPQRQGGRETRRGGGWLGGVGGQPHGVGAVEPSKKAVTELVPSAAPEANTIRHMVVDKATRQIWFGGDANMIGRVQVSSPPLVP